MGVARTSEVNDLVAALKKEKRSHVVQRTAHGQAARDIKAAVVTGEEAIKATSGGLRYEIENVLTGNITASQALLDTLDSLFSGLDADYPA